MTKLKNVNQIWIDLKVEGNLVLFLLFSDDGTINRKGDGSSDCNDNVLAIGKSEQDVFGKVKPYITQKMEEFIDGSYTSNVIKGRKCTLAVMLKSNEFEHSDGPPEPFRSLVAKSIEYTESWYQQQKKSAKPNSRSEYKFDTEPEKPWWKFW